MWCFLIVEYIRGSSLISIVTDLIRKSERRWRRRRRTDVIIEKKRKNERCKSICFVKNEQRECQGKRFNKRKIKTILLVLSSIFSLFSLLIPEQTMKLQVSLSLSLSRFFPSNISICLCWLKINEVAIANGWFHRLVDAVVGGRKRREMINSIRIVSHHQSLPRTSSIVRPNRKDQYATIVNRCHRTSTEWDLDMQSKRQTKIKWEMIDREIIFRLCSP